GRTCRLPTRCRPPTPSRRSTPLPRPTRATSAPTTGPAPIPRSSMRLSQPTSATHPAMVAMHEMASHDLFEARSPCIGPAPAYGGDAWTARFQEIMTRHFGPDAQAFPVFNGTGANVLALQSALPRWAAVITAASAHINYDETGAPEKVGGLKIVGAATENGKLTPETIKGAIIGRGHEHNAQPLAVSISQSTEWGTTYTPEEIAAIGRTAHELDMIVHVDGSRLGNAAAHLG